MQERSRGGSDGARHAVHGHVHYGSEIDLQLQGTWRRLTGLVKLADYSADRYATHTRKLWLEMDYVL